MIRRLRCILALPFHHHGVRVDERVLKSVGESPPPLYPGSGGP
jgi:hypothetical protein